MCGRYAFFPDKDKFYERFDVENRIDVLNPNYNVTPLLFMPVIINNKKKNYIFPMRWGFVPSWATNPAIGNHLINARAETLPSRPTFKSAFKTHRCLIPANGFFEWTGPVKHREPYYFYLKNEPIFSFAGLFENNTFTIVTTAPNEKVQSIHDRMPAILKPEDETTWLNPAIDDTATLLSLLHPRPADDMDCYPVSDRLNGNFINSPELIEPLKT